MTLPQVEGQFGTAARAVTVEGQQPGTGCPIQTMTYQEVSVSVYPVSCFLPGRFGLPRSWSVLPNFEKLTVVAAPAPWCRLMRHWLRQWILLLIR